MQVSERCMWRALDDVTADPYIANEDSLCPGVSWPYFATSMHTVWIVLDSGTNRTAVSTCSDYNQDTTRHIAIWPRQPSTQTCFPMSFKPDGNGFSVLCTFSQKTFKVFPPIGLYDRRAWHQANWPLLLLRHIPKTSTNPQ